VKIKSQISTGDADRLRVSSDSGTQAALIRSNGGYYSDLIMNGNCLARRIKWLMTQARHIWSASNTAMFYQKDMFFELLQNMCSIFSEYNVG